MAIRSGCHGCASRAVWTLRLMGTARILTWAACAIGVVCAPAAAKEPIDWQTGSQFAKQLEQPVGITWSGQTLRAGLQSLAERNRVAVLLDRRIDPGQELNLDIKDQTLLEAFDHLAADRRMGLSLLGSVAYFGPTATAEKLRTVAALREQEIAELPAVRLRVWQRRQPLRWPDRATPRQLLADLAADAGVIVHGAEDLPHDLWAAADLPPLSLAERLTLVLAQFDLTFQVAANGAEIGLSPLPEEVAIERAFPTGSKPAERVRDYRRLLPDCEVELAGGKIVVRGRVEAIERIEVSRQGSRVATRIAADPMKRYSMAIQSQPLRAVLNHIAKETSLMIEIDSDSLKAAGITVEGPVTFTVEEATLDELLDAAVSAAQLSFRRDGQDVRVFAGEE